MNLSKDTILTIKQTVPVLREKGEAVTTRMYEILFAKYPETKPLFSNAVNQNVKLAQAIVAYAEKIEQLGDLEDVLDYLAQRHVRAGVQASHYACVADALMSAMVEVLGSDVATEEVTTAWTEAYNHLAQTLQAREAKLRAQQ